MLAVNSLREGGVYLLPDGEELVATNDRRGGFLLYTPSVWAAFRGCGPAEYDAVRDGVIVTCSGRSTPWSVEDLADTGRTLEACPVSPEQFADLDSETTFFWWG
jgi:hypothetical protein